MGSLLWTGPRREYILFKSGGCQRVALPATERHPLCDSCNRREPMVRDNKPNTPSRRGNIVQFLRRNYFLIRLLDDGQQVVAAMPEKFLAKAGIGVGVELVLRNRPRLPIIVGIGGVWICGPGR